jgi:hypothetical protein
MLALADDAALARLVIAAAQRRACLPPRSFPIARSRVCRAASNGLRTYRAPTKRRRHSMPQLRAASAMLQADLERLHKYMREIERIEQISDEMRAVIESECPELVYKLPPKETRA